MTDAPNNVERLYLRLRQMAADFDFKPQERINETALSKALDASRTPLREALNRLVAEGYLTFEPGRGFFCRALSPQKICHLYEARMALECEAMRLTLTRATDAQLQDLAHYLDQTEPDYARETDAAVLVQMDETFHTKLADLADNPELTKMLININGRIRLVRMMDLRAMRDRGDNPANMSAHRAILGALLSRDAPLALQTLRSHIELRKDHATLAVQNAYAQLYVAAD